MSTINAGRNLLSDTSCLDAPHPGVWKIIFKKHFGNGREQLSDKVRQMRKEEVSEQSGFK